MPEIKFPEHTSIFEIPGSESGQAPEVLPAYHKCLNCDDLGKTCGGMKLASFRSTESVRAYHRALKTEREIHLKHIYKAAPQIGHGTIDDYFGKGVQDFKWTTVSTIDYALVSICGDRVGLPPIDFPCPATYADIHARNEALSRRLDEAAEENSRLAQALETAENNAQIRLSAQRADLSAQIELLRDALRKSEEREADYLRRNDEKSKRIMDLEQSEKKKDEQMLKIIRDYSEQINALVKMFTNN